MQLSFCFYCLLQPTKEPWGKAGPGGKPWRSPKEVGNTFMKSLVRHVKPQCARQLNTVEFRLRLGLDKQGNAQGTGPG